MVTDAHFAALDARRRAQAASLLGRDVVAPAEPDEVAEKLRKAQEAHWASLERSRANFGEPGVYAAPEPPKPPHALDCGVELAGISYRLFPLMAALVGSVGLERLLVALIEARGGEAVMSALRELGLVDYS